MILFIYSKLPVIFLYGDSYYLKTHLKKKSPKTSNKLWNKKNGWKNMTEKYNDSLAQETFCSSISTTDV